MAPTKKAAMAKSKKRTAIRSRGGKKPSITKQPSQPGDDTNTAKTGFLSLPPELKNRIYDLVLVTMPGWPIDIRAAQSRTDRGKKVVKTWRRSSWREPALLRVCKEIRIEALPLYYGSNTFVVALFLEDLAQASYWLRSIIHWSGGRPTAFLSLTFMVMKEAWAKLEHFHPFLSLISDFGTNLALSLDREAKVTDDATKLNLHPQPPVFEMSRNTGQYIREAFAEIMKLGKRAFDGNWSEEYLEWRFGELLERLRDSDGGRAAAADARVKTRREKRKKQILQMAAAAAANAAVADPAEVVDDVEG